MDEAGMKEEEQRTEGSKIPQRPLKVLCTWQVRNTSLPSYFLLVTLHSYLAPNNGVI